MLRLTKKADYALIALSHLAAREAGASASAKEVAGRHGIPLPLLAKVLQKLARGGLLASVQGTNGGYKLARSADRISVFEVVKAIDGPALLKTCFTEEGCCYHTTRCTVREPLRRVHEGIMDLLAGISISDLARESPRGQAPAAGGFLVLHGLRGS
jgi:Rrf2 family protein